MSLKVQLPLNENTNNQGYSDVEVTNSNATSSTEGKIGGCYSFNGTNARLSDPVSRTYSYPISVCCWVCPTNATSTVTQYIISVNQDSSGSAGHLIGIGLYSAKLAMWAGGAYTTSSIALTNNTWYHLAATIDSNNNRTLYLNGQAILSGTCGDAPSSKWLTIGARSNSATGGVGGASYYYAGKINDFRLYDHCLSAKEVKEISKALIVHYPLNNQYESGQVNKYSGIEAEGYIGPGSFTRTKLVGERGYNYKLTRTGTGSNSYPNMDASAFTFTPGKTYFYSVKVRCNKWTKGNLNLRAARSNNDWVTSSTQVCNPTLADGKWHEYYVSQVVNETYERSGSTITCSPRLEFYSSNQNAEGTVYDMDFDIKDIQVIESDNYVPFIQNEYATNIVADTSGYKKNGKSSGTLVISTDTPRYNCCSVFNGTNSFIACGRGGMITGATDITLSFWCYSSDWTTINKIVSCTQQGGYNVSKEGSNLYWNIGTGTSSNTYVNVDAGALSNISAGWHHIATTYNGLAGKIYLDGVLKATTTKYTTVTPLYFHSSNGLFIGAEAGTNQTTPAGEYTACKISDLRIYATALSEEDIKELYQTSASVADNGTVMSYEFNEE